jgi:hypothetical protein
MRVSCPDYVSELKDDEVFVFGSNNSGFHGAGSAGLAQRGTTKNTWRSDAKFLAALKTPLGDLSRRGVWAELGIGRGYQQGNDGMSYAIATVTRPGAKRSIPLADILSQLIELGEFASNHMKLNFLVCILGGGYNGWTVSEIQDVYFLWCNENPPPLNVHLRQEYEYRT